MYDRVITGLLLVVAVIHLIPIAGFFGIDRLNMLYEIDIADRNLQILMRHRAVLFGILGGFITYAAFKPAIQPIAFVAGIISVASFFYLAFSVGEFNTAIRKIVIGDIVAAVALVVAIVIYIGKSD